MSNIYLPNLARIIKIQDETYDTKTFEFEFVDPQEIGRASCRERV